MCVIELPTERFSLSQKLLLFKFILSLGPPHTTSVEMDVALLPALLLRNGCYYFLSVDTFHGRSCTDRHSYQC
jgi:hypothetical protein